MTYRRNYYSRKPKKGTYRRSRRIPRRSRYGFNPHHRRRQATRNLLNYIAARQANRAPIYKRVHALPKDLQNYIKSFVQ